MWILISTNFDWCEPFIDTLLNDITKKKKKERLYSCLGNFNDNNVMG